MKRKFSKIKISPVFLILLCLPPLIAHAVESSKIQVGILVDRLGDETDALHQRITALTSALDKEKTSDIRGQVKEIRGIVTVLLEKIPARLAGDTDPSELIYPLKQIGKHLGTAQRLLQSDKRYSAMPSLKRAARWCRYFHDRPLLPLYMTQELIFKGLQAHEQGDYAAADLYYEQAINHLLKSRLNKSISNSILEQIESDLFSLKLKNKRAEILDEKESKKIWRSLKQRFRKVQKTSLSLWERDNFIY